MQSKYVLPLLLLAGNFSWILSAAHDQEKTGTPPGKLGPLQVTVTNVHHWMQMRFRSCQRLALALGSRI